MSEDRYRNQTLFHYPETVLAIVRSVNPITAQNRVLTAMVYALDGRGAFLAPVAPDHGVSRHVRKGQIVLLTFLSGFSAYPAITGILYNNERQSGYDTTLPPPHSFMSDQVYEHVETGGFIRFRSATATENDPGPDGDACLFDIGFASGANLAVHEYPNGGHTPTRAKASLTMPSGAKLVIDEPSANQATFDLELPSGFKITVDASGNFTIQGNGTGHVSSTGPMTVASSASVEVSAPSIALNGGQVSLGGDFGSGASMAFTSEVEALRNELQSHTHSNVRGGPDTSGPPTSTFTNINGTQNANGV
jgi:hypothetical protein